MNNTYIYKLLSVLTIEELTKVLKYLYEINPEIIKQNIQGTKLEKLDFTEVVKQAITFGEEKDEEIYNRIVKKYGPLKEGIDYYVDEEARI